MTTETNAKALIFEQAGRKLNEYKQGDIVMDCNKDQANFTVIAEYDLSRRATLFKGAKKATGFEDIYPVVFQENRLDWEEEK